MEELFCLFCGKNQKIKTLAKSNVSNKISYKNFSARLLPQRIHFQIVQCVNCSLIFSTPVFSLKRIKKLYSESVCLYTEQIPFLNKTYFQLFKDAFKNNSKDIKILEIGCGNGFFLKYLHDNGYKNVYGVEPSIHMIRDCSKVIRKNIKKDIFKKGLFPHSSFDAILIFHTLDHMRDIHAIVDECKKILKKKGKIIIVVHDTDGLSVKLFGIKSPIFDIQHTYLFNKKTLYNLFSMHSFSKIIVKNLTSSFQLSYWITLSPIPERAKYIINAVLKKLFVADIPVSIKGGNIALVASKD